ncbi:MAG TPA: hypothetical protein PK280_18215 [Planctomycetota bacterium]|nr:hypothetical protein [Planctomycetota bacterium]
MHWATGSLVTIVLALTAGALGAGEPAKAERKGPLAALPSAPGAHIEKIRALGEGEWLNLGSPAADPKWGRARGRAWGGKAFALAPDIRGAYFTGEGIHAFVKPDGYGMNDYCVYDINAHRWICTYPGTDTKAFTQQVKNGDLKANDHGQVVNREGRLMPGHLVHAWGFLTYDTDRKKMALMADCGYNKYFFPGTGYDSPKAVAADVTEGLGLIQEQIKTKPVQTLSPWFYDSATGEFERYPASAKPRALDGFSHPQFIYIPSKKQLLLFSEKKAAFFDPDQKAWTPVEVKGAGPSGGDIGACYDSKRDRIYSGAIGPMAMKKGDQNAILVYDIKTETWSKPDAKGECPQAWSTNRSSVHYDSAGDVVLVLDYADKKLYVYDPTAGSWGSPIPMPEAVQKQRGCGHAFYDPELNVHFVFFAGDSVDNGVMWAYRHKKAGK